MLQIKNFSIEIKIGAIFLGIVVLVTAMGILAYKRMSSIVKTIGEEAKPNVNLVVLRDIQNNLLQAESSVKIFNISREQEDLMGYYQSISEIDQQVDQLKILNQDDEANMLIIDSFEALVSDKFTVLDEMLTLQHDDQLFVALSTISKQLEKKDRQSQTGSPTQVDHPPQKRRIFSSIFNKKKKQPKEPTTSKQNTDSLVQADEDLAAKITKIKQDKERQDAQMDAQLLALTEQNQDIRQKINMLISEMEQKELENLLVKTNEAEDMVTSTNRTIAIFCVVAALLLLMVTYVIFTYIRKNNAYERALLQSRNEAKALAKAKERFLANMSHEIRTPMNAISGFTDQLLKSPLTAEQKEQATIVRKSSDHLLKVINDVLDFSKLNAKRMTFEQTNFEPEVVIKEVIELVRPQVDKKGIQLSYQLKKNTPKVLLGDPFRLKQIMLNILGNAVKYTEKGSITVHVGPELQDLKEVVLKVDVTDTGIGIPEGVQDIIFNAFQQADLSTERQYGGTGLGLSITKKLIEHQGGKIKLESIEGKGTSVHFEIPYQIGQASGLPKVEAPILDLSALRNKTILVADDEAYNQQLLEKILKSWGTKYTICDNGKEVLEALDKHPYDMILMDIRMPVMGGIETSKAIRKRTDDRANIPIIACTAAISEEDRQMYGTAMINAVIAKPFKEEELSRALLGVFSGEQVAIPPATNGTPTKENLSIDLNELRKASDGDDAFVKMMIDLFIKSTTEGWVDMKAALAKKDWEQVADQAHKLCSPCRHLGMVLLLRHLKEIEEQARSETDTASLPEKINELGQLIQQTIGLLEEELKSQV